MAKGEPTAMKGTAGYVEAEYHKEQVADSLFDFKMGQHVRDEVTGYMGTIVARCQYMAASSRYQVQANGLAADGAMVKAYWFDEGRLEAL